MNNNIKVNKAIDIISVGLMTIFMVLMAQYTVLTLAIVPIILAIFYVRKSPSESIILFLLLGILSFIFSFTKEYYVLCLCLLSLSLLLYFCIRFNLEDTNALILVFIVSAIFLNIGFYYLVKSNGIDLNKLVDEFIIMAKKEGFEYPKEILKSSLKNIPSILSVIGLIYGFVALKTTRNYLNYKDKTINDFSKINTFHVSIREVVFILAFALVLIIGAKNLGLDRDLVQRNVLSLGISLLQINGILTFDYVVESRKSINYRIFTWIFIILLFSFLSIFFLILGVVDTVFNIRGVLYARKKQAI